jgi:hypothetical protein
MTAIWQCPAKKINAYRKLKITGVEIHGFLKTRSWNMIQQVVRQIPMGVNDADPLPGFDVLED